MLPKRWKTVIKRMPSVIWILGGTLMIAGGGLAATFGWNMWSIENEKSGLIRAMAGELLLNQHVIIDPKYREYDESSLTKFVVYPRLQTAALAGAISSGLFNKEEDKVLFTRMMGFYEASSDFNLRLTISEERMAKANPQSRKVYRAKLRDGPGRADIMKRIYKLSRLLIEEYGIKESDTFFADDTPKTN